MEGPIGGVLAILIATGTMAVVFGVVAYAGEIVAVTVRAGHAGSHQGHGWETFTDQVIRTVNDKQERVVFILWGSHARRKKELIDTTRHTIIESAHPSPLSVLWHMITHRRPLSSLIPRMWHSRASSRSQVMPEYWLSSPSR